MLFNLDKLGTGKAVNLEEMKNLSDEAIKHLGKAMFHQVIASLVDNKVSGQSVSRCPIPEHRLPDGETRVQPVTEWEKIEPGEPGYIKGNRIFTAWGVEFLSPQVYFLGTVTKVFVDDDTPDDNLPWENPTTTAFFIEKVINFDDPASVANAYKLLASL